MPAFYREILKAELARRIDANPRYSLRSFARALKIDPTGLSRILAGKKGIEARTAQQIVEHLALADDVRGAFLQSAQSDRNTRILRGATRAIPRAAVPAPAEIPHDVFRVIGDWYHTPMMALAAAKGIPGDRKWLARAFGISQIEAKLALERLVRLGLFKTVDGVFRLSSQSLNTGDRDRTSAAHRRHQAQMLEKAKHSLENDPLEERSMTGMTMAIDEEKLPLARKLIQDFMESLCQVLESGEKRRAYQLSVSLFPLQKKESVR